MYGGVYVCMYVLEFQDVDVQLKFAVPMTTDIFYKKKKKQYILLT